MGGIFGIFLECRNSHRVWNSGNPPDFRSYKSPRESKQNSTPDFGSSKNRTDFSQEKETPPSEPRESRPSSRCPFTIPKPRSFKQSDTQSASTSRSDMRSDTHSGVNSFFDVHFSLYPNMQSDMRSDAHPDLHSNVHPNTHPDTPFSSNPYSDMRSDAHPDLHSNVHPNTHPDTPSGSASRPHPFMGSSASSASGYRNPFYCYFERQRWERAQTPQIGTISGVP